MTSRGIRNFNPGNIRKSSTVWQGMADSQPDPDFVTFKSAAFGIRAMAKNLLTYQNHDGCKTLRQIIGRYAPPNENNTGAYLAAVAAGVGVDADAEINVDSAAIMLALVRAIVLHENGENPYTDAQISEGIRLAGVADAKPPPLHTQHTFQAQAGACISAIGAACVAGVKGAIQDPASAAHSVKGVADSLGDYASIPMFGHVVTTLLTVAGGLTLVGLATQFMKQRTA